MWGNENAKQTGDSAGLQGTGRAGHRVRHGDAFAWRVVGEVLVVFLFLYICFICGLFVYISVMHTDLSQ